jgi:hypothetical protein
MEKVIPLKQLLRVGHRSHRSGGGIHKQGIKRLRTRSAMKRKVLNES